MLYCTHDGTKITGIHRGSDAPRNALRLPDDLFYTILAAPRDATYAMLSVLPLACDYLLEGIDNNWLIQNQFSVEIREDKNPITCEPPATLALTKTISIKAPCNEYGARICLSLAMPADIVAKIKPGCTIREAASIYQTEARRISDHRDCYMHEWESQTGILSLKKSYSRQEWDDSAMTYEEYLALGQQDRDAIRDLLAPIRARIKNVPNAAVDTLSLLCRKPTA
jgi:hypothetical protein